MPQQKAPGKMASFRLDAEDHAAMEEIARRLQGDGPIAYTKTDALRFALHEALKNIPKNPKKSSR